MNSYYSNSLSSHSDTSSSSSSNSTFTTYGYDTSNSYVSPSKSESPSTPYTITIGNSGGENMKRKQVRTCAKCVLNLNASILGIIGLIAIISSSYTYFSEIGFDNQFVILLVFGLSILLFSVLTCISVSRFGMTVGLCSCGGLLIITLFTILTSSMAFSSFIVSLIYGVFIDGYYRNTTTIEKLLNLPTDYINITTHEAYNLCCNTTSHIIKPTCHYVMNIVDNITLDCHSYTSFYDSVIVYVLYVTKIMFGICIVICVFSTVSSIMSCVMCKNYKRVNIYQPYLKR
jgi:hypothetical protein